MSFKSEIPFSKEATIKGIAISFSKLTKMVPKGFIQSMVKDFPPSTFIIINPKTTPRIIPIKIFTCRGNFFIIFIIS